jgi:Domain of unknown function (DUF4388)
MASQPATPNAPAVRVALAPDDGGPANPKHDVSEGAASQRVASDRGAGQPARVEPSVSGFDGHVHCTCLADLVQLECLSGARTVFCVMSQGRQGYLFFEAGRVVHAIAGQLVQEAATLEMLSWDNGSFVQRDLEWPRGPAMATSWQQLLMLSAQQRDESGRGEPELGPNDTAKRVVGLSSRRAIVPPKPVVPIARVVPTPIAVVAAAPDRNSMPTLPVVAVAPTPRAAVEPAQGVLGAVRLGANGEVQAARGQGQGLVALGAYTRHLCDLIGADLGLGAMITCDAQLAMRRVKLFVEPTGSCVAVVTPVEVELESAQGVFEVGGRDDGR